ncbi:hypothetical protein T06_16259 [Trichinella sp. T6]|nr:hypothetical protein T06_16259 [Trichinella sp. T6]
MNRLRMIKFFDEGINMKALVEVEAKTNYNNCKREREREREKRDNSSPQRQLERQTPNMSATRLNTRAVMQSCRHCWRVQNLSYRG